MPVCREWNIVCHVQWVRRWFLIIRDIMIDPIISIMGITITADTIDTDTITIMGIAIMVGITIIMAIDTTTADVIVQR